MIDFRCNTCRRLLARYVVTREGEMRVEIRCQKCGTYNTLCVRMLQSQHE